jgi:hypothetical protein
LALPQTGVLRVLYFLDVLGHGNRCLGTNIPEGSVEFQCADCMTAGAALKDDVGENAFERIEAMLI